MTADPRPPAALMPPGLDPCQYGPSGHCRAGRHEGCSAATVVLPAGYLTDRTGACILDRGAALEVGPRHVWRCPCWCHATAHGEAVWVSDWTAAP